MPRKAVMLYRLALLPIAVLCLAPALFAAPNVIVVITDDQGYGDLSIHGNPVLQTPNLDALAKQSIRLTDFHVSPMCTPTRGQLMTGIDALRNRAMNVSSGRTLLRRDLPTMANLMKDAGYRTGIFGKWHLGDNYPYRPQDRGFDEALWFPSSHIGAVPDHWENDYFDDVYLRRDKATKVEGYCTDVFFDAAMEWIDAGRDSGEPFFAYIPTNAPHGPLWVPDRYRESVRRAIEANADKLPDMPPGRREDLVSFLAMIANFDENLGRLLKFLDDRGMAEDTIVVFLTDNGSTMGPVYYNAGMRGGKTTLWEGGHRVPCFVRWPGGDLGEPRDVDSLTQVQDLLPTLLELGGIETSEDLRFDGSSLAGLLRRGEPLEDRMLVINYSRMPFSDEGVPASIPTKEGAAVLWKRWRLLHGRELYDLAADPAQTTDVAASNPEVVAAMREHLDRWWAGLGDVTKPERVVIGHPAENPARLTACEWLDVFIDQQLQVRRAVRRDGVLHLEVDRPGTYEFTARRWPEESKLPLAAAIPPTRVTDGQYPAGVGLPIAAARLRVGGEEMTQRAAEGDDAVRFRIELAAGPTELQATFLDATGQTICGAYYVEAEVVEGTAFE